MTEILKLNSIAEIVKENLPEGQYHISEDAKDPAGILVRSADMLSYEFSPATLAVARAGAGVTTFRWMPAHKRVSSYSILPAPMPMQ